LKEKLIINFYGADLVLTAGSRGRGEECITLINGKTIFIRPYALVA
jgi:hypothetical protein